MLTFRIHPEKYSKNGIKTKLINSEGVKFDILSKTGLDCLYLLEFDENTKNLSPDEFVRNILKDRLNAGILVAGFNYRFGKDRSGDAGTLEDLGRRYGIKVIIVPAVYHDGIVISSTLVRDCLAKGEIERVNGLLGRNYVIEGMVEEGRKKGTEIGFPTANIYPAAELQYPLKGVYATITAYDGKKYISVTNIGTNPTVGGNMTVIETHVIDHLRDLYGKMIKIEFCHRIRDEMVFDSVSELHEQIKKDIRHTTDYIDMEVQK
jgi:riboflavin kinase/FMN adenylyltransferase